MKELLAKRTENSKTYSLDKNKYRWHGSIGAIHYKDDYTDEVGQWKDINLTREGNRIMKAPYELTVEDKKLTLRDKKIGEVSTIELLSTNPVGIPFEVIPEFSAVRFQHVLPADKVPFDAQFRVTGKIPFVTRAFDEEGELGMETSLVDGILTENLSQVKDKATGLERVAKGPIRIDPTWQVGASTDDCYRRLGTAAWSLTALAVQVGAFDDSIKQYGGGMRFTNVTIPQGANISTATLILTSYAAYSAIGVKSRISAEDTDSALTFANDAAAFDVRWAARTDARVDWDDIPEWAQNIEYPSPEIKTVIQEVVSRVLWVSGNDIVIFWDDFEDRSAHVEATFRFGYSYNGSTTKAPQLVIDYTAGGQTESSWAFRTAPHHIGRRTNFYPDLRMD